MKRHWVAAFTVIALVAAFAAGVKYGRAGSGPAAGGAPTQGDAARKILHYHCPMHPGYTSDRPGKAPCCGMELEPVYADGGAGPAGSVPPRGAIAVSAERQQLIGVELGKAEKRASTHVVRTSARVTADETRIYRITAATPGWIEEALGNSVGSLVRKDEALATFTAREFLAAQQAYLYALDAKDRFTQQGAQEAQMASTNTQVQAAVENLRNLGMSQVQIDELARTRQRANTVTVRSPADGFIVARNVSPGQRFEPGDELYVVADLRAVWIVADVFQDEARFITPGMPVRVHVPGQGRQFDARVGRILPQFDAVTRTMKVRIETQNPGYQLRPDMFVDVELSVALPETLTVPSAALVDSGRRKVVYVAHDGGHFEPRRVETGWRFGDRVEIAAGLMDGEAIVVSGNFLIDSESRMKAAVPAPPAGIATDVICGMEVEEKAARAKGLVSEYQGRTYYFCADMCKREFDAAPARHAAK
jgi:RND family efflux transporter MFP subunit